VVSKSEAKDDQAPDNTSNEQVENGGCKKIVKENKGYGFVHLYQLGCVHINIMF